MRSRLYAGSVSLDKQVFTTAKRQGDTDVGHSSTSDMTCLPLATNSIDQLDGTFHGKSDYFDLTCQANYSTTAVATESSSNDFPCSTFVNYEWDPCIFEASSETFPDTDAILGTVVTIDQATGEENSATFSLLDVPTGILTDLSDLFVPSPGNTCKT